MNEESVTAEPAPRQRRSLDLGVRSAESFQLLAVSAVTMGINTLTREGGFS